MYRYVLFIALPLCISLYATAQYSNSFAGPYNIILKQIEHCENKGLDLTRFDKTRITKYNRTTYLWNCNFSMPYGFNDEIIVMMSGYVYGNGGWKVLQKNQLIGPACSTAKRVAPQLTVSVAKAMGTYPRLCPNPPGNYTIKDLPMNIELDIPILPYNKYLFEFWLNRKGQRLGCGKAFVDVVPKKGRKRKN